MEFIHIASGCYYFKSAVNIGYIVNGDKSKGMLIDAGLEASSAKKAIKHLKEENLPITHLFITHAHADHFGGAQYIQKNYKVHTIAPSLEEAVMRYPVFEPMYLFHGNSPLQEMRNKFLEAPSIRIDEICTEGDWEEPFSVEFIHLPGHSHNQFGVLSDGILYAADAFLGDDVLDKHKIPFIVDATENLATLNKLKAMNLKGMVPGHGYYVKDYNLAIQNNMDVHENIANKVYETIVIAGTKGVSFETLVAQMLMQYEITPLNIGMYTLFRTAVTAYMIQLLEEEKAEYKIQEGRPVIFSV
ncbi:MBL fold metallo-hydrolase [Fictibacillus barbaricus]|uniref:MBL fold metallo-hydrolase n=1 Tax=Fictibacillus barbaricus TaxID=182136 RepID=A0ABS2ZDP9_9BACL|nr:MBL fold metallo-hydrolase [Fictibacillus barbaricus]MBN3546060.1 MBL fold metallo-hydrolase [Fictibacillus barbaricus]GGB58317.1 MBL fold metallo-hydrolase [Fictibacillus barbaricus]